MKGFRFVAALIVAALVTVAVAEDASAQLLRRGRGNCNSGGCNVSGGGCNVGSSQGCNISQAPQTRATAEDLLEQVTAKKAGSAPVLPAKQSPLVLNESAALAFCAPVTRSKHPLDLEKIVYRPQSTPAVESVAKSVTARPPIRSVASR